MNQGSRIKDLQSKYRKYSELLPQELYDLSLYDELANNKLELISIFNEDINFLRNLIQKSHKRIDLRQFENSEAYLIRRGFLQKNEYLTGIQNTKYLISHLFMCKSTLLFLADKLLDTLPIFNEYFLKSKSSSGRDKRIAFMNMIREYQNLLGLTANIVEVIEEFKEIFNVLWKELDAQYVDDGSHRFISDIILKELIQGVTDLLLRGSGGRYTPVPLIRSALEIMILRTVFNTKYSIKYKDRKVLIENSFVLNDILSAADRLKIQFHFGTDSIRKLYSWGSISTHYALRMRHHEMWHSLQIIQHLRYAGLIIGKDEEAGQIMDSLLDELILDGKIRID
jgi:hypothetical protein